MTLEHDTTDADQSFPAQTWIASCNSPQGASVRFSITPFANGATLRNAGLAATINQSDAAAHWSLGTSSHRTDYAAATPNAVVGASSSGPGDASFDLLVTFIDSDFSQLPSGDFVATMTGTISAN
ncbi:MAG: hypothetical protein KDA75_09075 [Planctomycetaceae bacterium]|nr:hypothetical protein [Planctomycetaceae bacterium]